MPAAREARRWKTCFKAYTRPQILNNDLMDNEVQLNWPYPSFAAAFTLRPAPCLPCRLDCVRSTARCRSRVAPQEECEPTPTYVDVLQIKHAAYRYRNTAWRALQAWLVRIQVRVCVG